MGREDERRLLDMSEAAEDIEEFTKEVTFDEFEDDKLVKRAVEREVEIIGEAAKNISDEFKAQHPEIDWKSMARARDLVIHAYGKVEEEELWKIVTDDIPALIEDLEQLLG